MSLLGIDIGSTNCKGVVISNEGNVLAEYNRGYSLSYFPDGKVEIDANVFWNITVEIIRKLSMIVADKDSIEALAISSHGETIIPVDAEGEPVGPAIMNSDCRAKEEAEWWEKIVGKEKIYAITGSVIHPIFAMPKILWLKHNKPEEFSRVKKYLAVGDFILQKMELPAYIDYSLASRFMVFDVKKKNWSNDILSNLGLDSSYFSTPVCAGHLAGKLNKNIADTLSLKTGTVVAVGGHDQPCGALGTGAITDGDVSDSAGPFECVTVVDNSPCLCKAALKYSLNSYCHVVPEKYVTLAFFPSGLMLNWFKDNILQDDFIGAGNNGENIYDYFEKGVPIAPTGICITPHLIGSYNPLWNPNATSTISGLTLNVTKYHIYKAILEGNCCELDLNLQVLEKFTGELNSLRISGGGAKSKLWLEMRADITGKKIITQKISEATCLGAALLAGIAAGIYKDANEAVIKTVKIDQQFNPSATLQKKYAKQKQEYRNLLQLTDI